MEEQTSLRVPEQNAAGLANCEFRQLCRRRREVRPRTRRSYKLTKEHSPWKKLVLKPSRRPQAHFPNLFAATKLRVDPPTNLSVVAIDNENT